MSAAITWPDLSRLATEIADGDKEAWLAERGIPEETIVLYADSMASAFEQAVRELGGATAFDGVVSWAFQIGWEACEQFGGGDRG